MTEYEHYYAVLSQEQGDEVVQKLENNEVVGLKFNQCEIPEDIAIAILAALKSNESVKEMKIDIQMNGARTHDLGDKFGLALAEMLEKNTALEALELSNCVFTDETGAAVAAALAKNAMLKRFSLYNCAELTDALSKLTESQLNYQPVSPKELADDYAEKFGLQHERFQVGCTCTRSLRRPY